MNRKKNRLPGGNRKDGDERGQRFTNHTTNGQRVSSEPIAYRSVKGAFVCEQRGDTVYKDVYSSRGHILYRPPAIASDVAILEEAQDNGARWFEVTDKDTGKVYRASIADFWRHGHKRNHKKFGLQRALPLEHWQTRRVGEQPVEQLALFGGAP